MFYVLALDLVFITVAIDTNDARFITTRHKRAVPEICEFKGFAKQVYILKKFILRIQESVVFYSEKCIRHAFQVFRKSSPVGLTIL